MIFFSDAKCNAKKNSPMSAPNTIKAWYCNVCEKRNSTVNQASKINKENIPDDDNMRHQDLLPMFRSLSYVAENPVKSELIGELIELYAATNMPYVYNYMTKLYFLRVMRIVLMIAIEIDYWSFRAVMNLLKVCENGNPQIEDLINSENIPEYCREDLKVIKRVYDLAPDPEPKAEPEPKPEKSPAAKRVMRRHGVAFEGDIDRAVNDTDIKLFISSIAKNVEYDYFPKFRDAISELLVAQSVTDGNGRSDYMAAIHGLIKNGMPKSEFLKQEIGSRECILKQVGGSCFLFSVLNLLAYSPLRPYYLHLIRSLRIDPSRLCADISECDRLLRSLSPHYRDRSADDGGDSLHVLMNVIMKSKGANVPIDRAFDLKLWNKQCDLHVECYDNEKLHQLGSSSDPNCSGYFFDITKIDLYWENQLKALKDKNLVGILIASHNDERDGYVCHSSTHAEAASVNGDMKATRMNSQFRRSHAPIHVNNLKGDYSGLCRFMYSKATVTQTERTPECYMIPEKTSMTATPIDPQRIRNMFGIYQLIHINEYGWNFMTTPNDITTRENGGYNINKQPYYEPGAVVENGLFAMPFCGINIKKMGVLQPVDYRHPETFTYLQGNQDRLDFNFFKDVEDDVAQQIVQFFAEHAPTFSAEKGQEQQQTDIFIKLKAYVAAYIHHKLFKSSAYKYDLREAFGINNTLGGSAELQAVSKHPLKKPSNVERTLHQYEKVISETPELEPVEEAEPDPPRLERLQLMVLASPSMGRRGLFDPGLVLHSPIPFDPVGSKLDDKEKIPDYEAPTDWNFAVVEQSPASIREGVGGGRRRGAVWGLSAALAAVTALAAAAPRPSDQRRG